MSLQASMPTFWPICVIFFLIHDVMSDEHVNSQKEGRLEICWSIWILGRLVQVCGRCIFI